MRKKLKKEYSEFAEIFLNLSSSSHQHTSESGFSECYLKTQEQFRIHYLMCVALLLIKSKSGKLTRSKIICRIKFFIDISVFKSVVKWEL